MMPKRSDRDIFPEAFTKNPFKGSSLKGMFKKLQWGNNPVKRYDIDAPEDLAMLGCCACLFYEDGREYSWDEDNAPVLAVGKESNQLYIFPEGLKKIPMKGYHNTGEIEQIDYFSDKGNEPAYYYHQHEEPFPSVWQSGRVLVVRPADNDGEPSYAVVEEGIIG